MSEPTRVEVLTLRALDGDASAEEREELSALVASGGEAFERYCALLDLEATLRGDEAPAALAGRTMERVRQAQADRVSAGVMDRIRRRSAGQEEGEGAPAADDEGPVAEAPEPLPASTRRLLGWGAAAALAVLMIGAALALGYHLGRSETGLPSALPPRAHPVSGEESSTRTRIERAENEVRRLRQQIADQRRREDTTRAQDVKARQRTHNAIASLRKELQGYVDAQKALVTSPRTDSWADTSRVAKARTQLRKLQQLRDKVRVLEKQVPVEQLKLLQALLVEIRKHARAVRSILRIARGARRMRRPAHRRLAQPGRRPRGSRRAASAFDEPFSD